MTWLLLASSVLLSLLAAECALRLLGTDRRLMSSMLYYQAFDIPVHRVSQDPFLHYELAPFARLEATEGRSYSVSIGRNGVRLPDHPDAKSSGTFRILAFGGSTMYGFQVNDDETIAARLEAALNRQASGRRRYEVWNYGTCAYTAAQTAYLARRELQRRDPDLILMQMFNDGRRPFLMGPQDELTDFSPFLSDRQTVLENLPPPAFLADALHVGMVRYSAIYRSLAAVQRGWDAPGNGRMDTQSEWGVRLSAAEVQRLVDETNAHHVPVVAVVLPRSGSSGAGVPDVAWTHVINLWQPDRPDEFYSLHPSAPVLAEWATTIAAALEQTGFLRENPSAAAVVSH